MANRHMKRSSAWLIIRETQIKPRLSERPSPERTRTMHVGEDAEEREPCVLLVGMEPGAATVENRRFRRKVQTERPCDPAAPLPGTRRSLLVVLRGQRDPISAPKATDVSSAAGVRGALYPPVSCRCLRAASTCRQRSAPRHLPGVPSAARGTARRPGACRRAL